MTCSAIGMCYVPKEARLMDTFAKLIPLFCWQTTPSTKALFAPFYHSKVFKGKALFAIKGEILTTFPLANCPTKAVRSRQTCEGIAQDFKCLDPSLPRGGKKHRRRRLIFRQSRAECHKVMVKICTGAPYVRSAFEFGCHLQASA